MLDEIIKKVENLSIEKQEELLNILQEWQTGKHREFHRSKIKTSVDVAVGSRVIQSDTRDVSAGGLYINTSGKIKLNETVRMVFNIPGADKPFKLTGKIIRVEKDGIAIEFEKVTPYFRSILDGAIMKVDDPES